MHLARVAEIWPGRNLLNITGFRLLITLRNWHYLSGIAVAIFAPIWLDCLDLFVIYMSFLG